MSDETLESQIVGRVSQFETIRARLDEDDVRVLTLRGPGGVGKTTLARALVSDGDAPFVELDVCDTIDDVVGAVGEALGLPDVARSLDGVRDTLTREKTRLVVLDNAEHISEAVAHAVSVWLEGTLTTFLITSRERTGLSSESIVDIMPLEEEDARKLFEIRAREAVPGFTVDDENRADVDELIELVDGLPLAIELAAARVRILSPRQICERLGKQFELLKNERGAVDRHATLDACVEWSWDMLTDELRSTLTQCAMFRGRFGIDDAEAVVTVDGWVGESLEQLVERSLIWVERGVEVRFSLFDSVRRFIERRVEFQDTHIEQFMSYWLERTLQRRLAHADLVNVVHAIELGIDRSPDLAIELLVEARQRLWRGGFLGRVYELLERAVKFPDLTALRKARLTAALASHHYALMEYEECDEALSEAYDLVEDDETDEGYRVKAGVAMMRGLRANETYELEEAAKQFEFARSLLDHVRLHERAHILAASAMAALKREEFSDAIALYEDAIEAARKSEEKALLARTLSWSSMGYSALGEVERTIDRLTESLELFEECDDVVSLTQAQYACAQALIKKDPDRALAMARQAVASSSLGRLRVLEAATRVLVARLEGGPEAPNTIRRALRVFGEDSAHNDRWAVWLALVVVLVREDDLELACREMQALYETVGRLGVEGEQRFCAQYLAVLHALCGRLEEAVALVDDEFGAAVRRAVEHDGVVPEDLERWDDPYQRMLHDYCPSPLELYDEGLAARTDVQIMKLFDDGTTVVLPDGEKIDLEARYVLRRLLLALCEARLERPGETMTLDELVQAGWPDESMTYESGIRRVYSAIRNLRKLGLEDVVLTGENGYLIDPELKIVRTTSS